ncbi:MAG: TetR/AcrR family transcriptional regulator [Chloroflexi bacterium]|nr:TetR/AcrR family transcriptional regulator [Chloroflexota bacterium]
MTPAHPNLQDPRVKRTRQLLLDAFLSLLTDRGFEDVTVQDIAERATVNRATFYAHYKDKFDLAESLVREHFQERLAGVIPPTTPVTAASLETLVATVLEYLADRYGHCKLDRQFAALLESTMHETLHTFIADWLGYDRRAGTEAGVDTAALVVSSALIRAGIQWSGAGRQPSAGELAHQVASVLAPGVVGAVQPASPTTRQHTPAARGPSAVDVAAPAQRIAHRRAG